MQEAADDLVSLYKRVSLDDDLDDRLRGELLSGLSAGAAATAATLRLVYGQAGGEGGTVQGEKRGWESDVTGPAATNTPHLAQQDISANPYFQVHGTHSPGPHCGAQR